MTKNVAINGMHCAACKVLIEEVGMEQPGVQSITVDVAAGTATIEHDETFDGEKFKSAVAELGEYEVA